MRGWLAAGGVILAVILVPFFVWESSIHGFTDGLNGRTGHPVAFGFVLGSLLALDIVLPVPSSIVSTLSGVSLGFWAGMAVNWIGMTAGCAAGYWIGAAMGRTAIRRIIDAGDLERMSRTWSRFGDWSVVLCRAVPVLAEASVFFAGIARHPFARFFTISTLANGGVAAVFAWMGAYSRDTGSFLAAFAGAVLLPGLGMFIGRQWSRK
ncbi:MAG: TVP38/TMEM64 family protein [Bryobacteraceae bacterium]